MSEYLLRRRMIAAGLTLSIPLGSSACSGPNAFTPQGCKAAPAATIYEETQALLDAPRDEAALQHPKREQAFNDYGRERARQLGLKVIDTTAIVKRLTDDYYTDAYGEVGDQRKAMSIASFMKLSNKAAANFGFQFRTAQKGEMGILSIETPSKKWMRWYGKVIIAEVLDKLDERPAELVSFTGLKEVILAKNLGYRGLVSGKSMILEVQDRGSAEAFDHELGHVADEELCGAKTMWADTPFANLNGDTPIYNQVDANGYLIVHDSVYPSYTRPKDVKTMNKLKKSLRRAEKSADIQEYCEARYKLTALHGSLMSWSNYHPNVVEDKAETMALVLRPDRYKEVAPDMPTLKAKFEMQLARMYQKHKPLATWLINTSQPYTPKESTIDC